MGKLVVIGAFLLYITAVCCSTLLILKGHYITAIILAVFALSVQVRGIYNDEN